MTITVGGTAITFNDGTTQTTSAKVSATAGTLYEGYYNGSYRYDNPTSSYTKVAAVRCIASGTVRVYWTMSDLNGFQVFGRVYKNGVAVGTERMTSSANYQQYTDDISVATGDIIQIYIRGSSSSIAMGALGGVGASNIASFPLIAAGAIGNGVTVGL